MELNWLEDFVALSETRNFSRAAELRHITQPAFSRRIKALEDWVGVSLFDRGTHRVSLTTAGEQFQHGAGDLIRRVTQLCAEAREAGGRETATLRFAATHSLSFSFFPEWMRKLASGPLAGPVRLVSDSMQACEELMLHGQVQFVICHRHPLAVSRFSTDQFRSQVIGNDALLPYAAPDASLDSAGQPKWTLREGADDTPYLAYSPESGLGRIIEAHRFSSRARGLHPVFSGHLAASLLSMARDGWGIAWLPSSLAEHDLAAGRLVRAGGDEWAVPMEVCIYRPAARQSMAAESLWQQIRDTGDA